MAVRAVDSSYRWVILALAFTGQMGYAVCFLAVGPLAPLFQPELGLSKIEVGFFSAAASAGSAVLVLAAGSLTDRFGVRLVMSLGLLGCGGFMLAMSAVESFPQAMGVMFAAGLAGALVLPGVSKAIMDWFPPSRRGTVMGLKQAAVPLAGALTASILPALGLTVGWRASVAVVGSLSIAGGIATTLLYRDYGRPAQGKEPGGGMRAGLGVVLRSRRMWILGVISFSYVAVQLALSSYLALYLAEVVLVSTIPEEGARIVAAGGYLALCQAGGVFGRVFWGAVSDRAFQGRRILVLAIVGAIATPLAFLVAELEPAHAGWLMGTVLFIYGATAIGWNGLFHVVITETAGLRYAATGVGFAMTLNQVGTMSGPPVFGLVVDVAGSYHTAWVFLGALSAVGTLTSMSLIRGEKRNG